MPFNPSLSNVLLPSPPLRLPAPYSMTDSLLKNHSFLSRFSSEIAVLLGFRMRGCVCDCYESDKNKVYVKIAQKYMYAASKMNFTSPSSKQKRTRSHQAGPGRYLRSSTKREPPACGGLRVSTLKKQFSIFSISVKKSCRFLPFFFKCSSADERVRARGNRSSFASGITHVF